MRRAQLLLCFLGCACLVSGSHAAFAAPKDFSDAPSARMRWCEAEHQSCTVSAVADLNGDGIQDMVLERAAEGSRSDGIAAAFEVDLSPYGANPDAQAAKSVPILPAQRTLISMKARQNSTPPTAVDANGDGVADLVFFGGVTVASRREHQQVLVLFGRTTWAKSYNLDSSDHVDLTIDRFRQVAANEAFASSLSAAFADVNADGKPDLVLGVASTPGNGAVGSPMGPGSPSRGGDARGTARPPAEVGVMFGTGKWPAKLDWKPQLTVTGMGPCADALAGAHDVTGDGVADLVVRKCATGMPTQLRVVPGRGTWPATIQLAGSTDTKASPSVLPTEEPQPPQPPPGGGYGKGGNGSNAATCTDRGEPVIFGDLNGDGVLDVGMVVGEKSHLWYGGRDLAERMEANRTSGIILGGGVGGLAVTNGWRVADMNNDGTDDLVMTKDEPSFVQAMRAVPRGAGGSDEHGAPKSGIGCGMKLGRSAAVYTQGQIRRRVLDTVMDAPDLVWPSFGSTLWGIGDFNGDGVDDLLLGPMPGSHNSQPDLQVVYGPLGGK